MFNQNTINPFIDQVVLTIDSMFENKNIPQSLKDYLYLICTGMILNYGTSYTKDIYKAINETRYIYGIKDLEYKHLKTQLINLITNASNLYIDFWSQLFASHSSGNEDLLFTLSQIKNSIPQRALHPSAIFSMDVEGMLTNITTNLDSTIKKLQERQEAILNETEEREKYVQRKLYEL